ncbi:MAG TPA: TIGR03435 family protein [Bryobacteraceae bacterium]
MSRRSVFSGVAVLTAGLLAMIALVAGQALPPVAEFDAISLRPYRSSGPIQGGELSASQAAASSLRGGPGTADPERIAATGITLRGLVAAAFGVLSDQVLGPGWIGDERYVLQAKVPPGATREQASLMLQNALMGRFNLVVHYEKRQFQIWELGIAKDGPKLKEAVGQNAPPQMNTQVRDGLRHDIYRTFRISNREPNDSSPSLDKILSLYLAATGMVPPGTLPSVVDKTGLTGKYDFDLEYLGPAFRDRTDVSGPTLFDALEKQLGLRLEQKKATLDAVIVDHAEKTPEEN